MKTDLCADDMVVQLATPQLMAAEGMTAIETGGGGGGVGTGAVVEGMRASPAAVEFGRRLLVAARAGDTPTVQLLMAKGAPFTTDWLGTSPLHLAAGGDHADTVRVLLRAGVSRDARTKVERTPLHLAAYAGHQRTVAALCEGGAMVDARDLLRMTPLHWAVERGHVAAVRELLKHGADPHALSKFRKTPLGLAGARDPQLLREIETCLREREAQRSVMALERTTKEEAATTIPTSEPATVRIQRISETKTPSPKVLTPEKKYTKTTIKIDSAAGEAGAGAVAEALLRRHGITLLPHDDTNTVLSALQSGRTVVLSDAGKLMLKESNCVISAGAGVGATQGQAAGAGAGVVLTATPVAAPPPGVKVFTLNSAAKLRAPRAPPPPPAPALTPQAPPAQLHNHNTDVQQVKLVQLGGAEGGRGGGAAGRGGARGGGAGAVRIIMNKHNFRKLIATATRAALTEEGSSADVSLEESSDSSDSESGGGGSGDGRGTGTGTGGGSESVVVVPEQFVRSSSPQYLRSQLLCAHAALHHLRRRLQRARARLRRARDQAT